MTCSDLDVLATLFNAYSLGDSEARNTPMEKLIIDPGQWMSGPCSGGIMFGTASQPRTKGSVLHERCSVQLVPSGDYGTRPSA